MRFADLFAGLGGFHVALKDLGHECVFACEKDKILQALYKQNFGIEPKGDIRTIASEDVPEHDILCAGFPCQSFSKAGGQQGFKDPENGDLFEDHILRIIRYRQPRFIILENVPNLEHHNAGETWRDIERALDEAGYHHHEHQRYSPHHFGIPQIRDRLFIVASMEPLTHFHWPQRMNHPEISIRSILESPPPLDARSLSRQVTECLETWQAFIEMMPDDNALPSYPLWSMEFGADYPFEEATPYALGVDKLHGYRGSFGQLLEIGDGTQIEDVLALLPPYARDIKATFPVWKRDFIRNNRAFYQKYKEDIDTWLPSIRKFPASFQKLEWNCKGGKRDIWQYVIQFRASGVRVKRPTTAPSLIAMTSTQVPIIAWEKRYMAPRECAILQSLQSLAHLPASPDKAFAALGNAVNAHVARLIADALLNPVCSDIGAVALFEIPWMRRGGNGVQPTECNCQTLISTNKESECQQQMALDV